MRLTSRLTMLALAGTLAAAAATAAAGQDLRSPDARDAAEGRTNASAPIVVTLRPEPRVVKVASGGFGWLAVATGAAGAVGVMLLIGAATGRRRRSPRASVATG